MKKLLIITNLFWLSIFVFFACVGTTQISSNDCKLFCYDYSSQPLPGLAAKTAIDMADNYAAIYQIRNTSGGLVFDSNNKRQMDFRETKSVWFSLESMKRFIYHFEKNACQLNCKDIDKKALGVRFYFAKYPDQGSVANQIANNDTTFKFLTRPNMAGYYGRKTLFMVPTYWDNTIRTDKDFDPQWSVQKGKSVCIKDMKFILKENYNNLSNLKIMAGSPDPNDPNGMQNHNPLCPPDNCPGQSF